MIDWHKVLELLAEIGPADMAEVVALFLDDTDSALRILAPDWDLEAQLHYLKGSAMTMGFTAFRDLCAEGEAAASRGAVVDLDAVRAAYALSRAAFLEGLPAHVPQLRAEGFR